MFVLVPDIVKFKKLLELQGKSLETFDLSVPFFTVSENPVFLHGFVYKFPLRYAHFFIGIPNFSFSPDIL